MKCPHCQNSLEGSGFFEFFNCPHCQASLHEEAGDVKLLQEPVAHAGVEEAYSRTQENVVPEELVQERPVEDVQEGFVQTADAESEEEGFSENLNGSLDLSQQTNESIDEEVENSLHSQVEEEPDSVKSSDSDDLSSLEDFGEAPKDQCVYELKISEIHSKEVLTQLKGVLSQSLLKLNTTQIFSQIHNGQLTIHQLNSVQVIYIVKKLSNLPLNLSWVQKSHLSDK